MLSRLVSAGLRNTQAIRSIRMSALCLGGHGPHVPVPEPHIPRPQPQYETDWLGRQIVPRVSQDKHEHTSEDYASYAGGVLFVVVTVAAIAFYTDTFGMNIKKNWAHLHHKTFPKPAEPEPEPEPEVPEPEPVKPVKSKIVVDPTPTESETTESTPVESSPSVEEIVAPVQTEKVEESGDVHESPKIESAPETSKQIEIPEVETPKESTQTETASETPAPAETPAAESSDTA